MNFKGNYKQQIGAFMGLVGGALTLYSLFKSAVYYGKVFLVVITKKSILFVLHVKS